MAKWQNWMLFGSLFAIILFHLLVMFFTLSAGVYKFHNISTIVLCVFAIIGALAKKW